MFDRRGLITASVAAAVLPAAARAASMPGVTDTEIKIGNTQAYSGPASAYATNAKTEAAYFKMVNEQGGIAGRKLNFISYDDSASPPKAIEQVRRLIEQDEVAFLFNTFGTASNSATARYVNQQKVPQLFIYSGADKWRDYKTYPWTIGWQPSYRTEGQIYATYIKATKPGAKVGILYQNDDFGKDYAAGVKDVLGSSATVALASHEFLDATIDSQVLALREAKVDVLISGTSPKFVAMTIRKIFDLEWKPLHIISNIATSIAAVMGPAGPERGIGIVSSAYVKDPNDPAWAGDAGLRDWRAFMAKHYPEGDLKDINNVYGFGFATTMVHVLKACNGDFSRANVMKQATSIDKFACPALLPGITVNTSPTDYRPIKQMQLIKFDGTSWQRFGDLIEGSKA